jgi:hypothetical protein
VSTAQPLYGTAAALMGAQLTTAPVLPAKGAPTMDTTATAETTEAPATAADQLQALLAEHDAAMVIGDLGESAAGWGARVYGRITLVFPEGQDPAVRLAIARREIARLEAAAAERLMASDPCDSAWCKETDPHTWCYGREIGLSSPWNPAADGVMQAYLLRDRRTGETFLNYGLAENDETRLQSGDALRAETARVRAHLVRLDALADQFDAIREAGGAAPVPAAGSGHFPWCAPGGCTPHDDAATEHESAWNTLPNHGRHPGRTGPLLKSALHYSADLGDSPEVGVSFLGEGATYTGPEADALIADFETFLAGLKAQRALLGERPAAR